MMRTLSPELRKQLERTVGQARGVAEAGARVALEALAVQHHEPYGHMTSEQRTLRRRLRAHARQLGDRLDARSGSQGTDRLVHECAYEHWHGMLFARFLAENHLLIEPEMGVAINLEECEELAKEDGSDKWVLAARFAHRMLPQVFRPDHPLFEVRFAREYRLKLEPLVEDLAADVFTATDSLGWVYQFWQSKKKDEVNRSEVKIGADELPAVTQLFTEPYMVQFLLHNSLGAWWVSRYPDRPYPVDLIYLRVAPSPPEGEDGSERDKKTPAAGTFDGWPDDLLKFKLLDPCCGSGHFLVAAFLMLVPMRIALEALSPVEAVDAVLRDNLHGLELDQRCVAIAAFALALEAWRYPNAGGYRPLPRLNLAWSGQPVFGKREQWLALADGDERLEAGMTALYDTFREAPVLGSLIDPTRSVPEDLLTAGFAELKPLLERALREHAGDEEWEETAIAARGLTEAARLLAAHYHLVVTNVPYLARGRQATGMQRFCDSAYPLSKKDLGTAFIERCLSLAQNGGEVALVCTQYWLFLAKYKRLRKHLLLSSSWNLIVKLGTNAFHEISGEAVNVGMFLMSAVPAKAEHTMTGLECTEGKSVVEKASCLYDGQLLEANQLSQFTNPDHVATLTEIDQSSLLSAYVKSYHGISTTDYIRFGRKFWELPRVEEPWVTQQSTVKETRDFGGREHVLLWEQGKGGIRWLADHGATVVITGLEAWSRQGVVVSQMGSLPATRYTGQAFDDNVGVLVPNDEANLGAVWAFCSSPDYAEQIRELDQSFKVTYPTLAKVPFDFPHWQEEARKRYPRGLPKLFSNDPTQWIFHGHPRPADSPLQVAVARLLGYHWPAELQSRSGFHPLDEKRQDGTSAISRVEATSRRLETRRDGASTMELSDEARAWIDKTKALHVFEDEDGIVCLPSIRGEPAAHERLLHLLEAAWGEEWSNSVLSKLVWDAGAGSLDDWLRNQFFEQHCKLFHHRPFVWHIWDGRKRDGFHVLVNYHKLAEGDGKGRRLLETLTYSYLSDWIARQQDGVKRGEGGAEGRLAAALELRKRLVAIIEGEPPFDIFVRWKPIEEQPIGWEPDINDGVRLNIRPFMAQDLPGGKRGAGILRAKPNIDWNKDRGKEPMRPREHFPWFWNTDKHTGERVNDVHLLGAEKHAARESRVAGGTNRGVNASVSNTTGFSGREPQPNKNR